MRNDPRAEVTQRSPGQLKDGEWVQGVVVVVVVVDGEFLRRIQDLIEPELELISAVPGFHDILRLRTCPTGSRQELLRQIYRHGIKTLRWNRSHGRATRPQGGRENRIPRR